MHRTLGASVFFYSTLTLHFCFIFGTCNTYNSVVNELFVRSLRTLSPTCTDGHFLTNGLLRGGVE